MVFIDQRGTGGSNPLPCPVGDAAVRAFLGGDIPPGRVRECRAELEKKADLRHYTTIDAADDIEDVRRWLGHDKINISGASAAARLVFVYAQRHGEHVRTLTMKAATPFANRNPLYVPRDSQAALDKLFADCAADAACHAAYPSLKEDFAAILEKPADPMTRDVFAGAIRRMLNSAEGQRAIPLAITAAKRGDFAPLKQALGAAAFIDKVLNLGTFLSSVCSEDTVRYSEKEAAEMARGTFSGPVLAKSLLAACREWPIADVPQSAFGPVKANVPAIVVSGTLDPQTPPVWGREMAKLVPGAMAIDVESIAHSGPSPCVAAIVSDFVARGTTKGLDISCAAKGKRPAFVVP